MRGADSQQLDIQTYLTVYAQPLDISIEVRQPELPPQLQLPPNTVDAFQSQLAESYLYGGLARNDLPRWAGRTAIIYLGGAHAMALLVAFPALLQSVAVWFGSGDFTALTMAMAQFVFTGYSLIVLRFILKRCKRYL